MRTRIRLNLFRWSFTFMLGRGQRLGARLHRDHGDVGIPGLGMVIYLRKMPVTPRRFSVQVVRPKARGAVA